MSGRRGHYFVEGEQIRMLPPDDGIHSTSDNIPLRQIGGHTTPKRRVGALDVSNPLEHEALIDTGPVKLTPGWESFNVHGDDVSFKKTVELEEFHGKPPKDRFNLLYFILVIHGVGTLMPWNMFINAKSYFVEFKLAASNSTDDDVTKEYREHFISYLVLASQLPNLLCNLLNLFIQFGAGSLTVRIVCSIIVEVIIFIVTVVLAMVDSLEWPGTFFYLTMATIVVLNMASGVYQNSIYGVAAKLPQRYTNAVVLGSNISGTLTSVIHIFSIAASPNLRTAAIYYFISALFILLVCLDSYFALPLLRFFRYHERVSSNKSNVSSRLPPYCSIFKKVWPQCFNVFCIFFVTLALFPSVQSDIKAVDPNFILNEKYFAAVACFLNFNFFAMLGNIVPIWIRWPGPKFVWIPIVLRFAFIPFFIFCNYLPAKRILPVYIDNDWAYIAAMIVFAFTSGYYSSLAMMYAPGCVGGEHTSVAGMMAAFFLVLGIFTGGNFTFFISWIVTTKLV